MKGAQEWSTLEEAKREIQEWHRRMRDYWEKNVKALVCATLCFPFHGGGLPGELVDARTKVVANCHHLGSVMKTLRFHFGTSNLRSQNVISS
jgi:hypothetical protein